MTDTDHLAAPKPHRPQRCECQCAGCVAAGVTLAPQPDMEPHPGEHHDYHMTCARCGEPGYLFVGFHSPGEGFKWMEADHD